MAVHDSSTAATDTSHNTMVENKMERDSPLPFNEQPPPGVQHTARAEDHKEECPTVHHHYQIE